MSDAELVLPSAGPDPIPLDTALAAVLGYARGRRPLYFRAPNARTGRWVELPAFGYERFDRRPRSDGPLGEPDILTAEGLHGRLDPAAWAAMKAVLDDVRPLADAVVERAAGRALRRASGRRVLRAGRARHRRRAPPADRAARAERPASPPSTSPRRCTTAARRSFPLLVRTTRWQLLPHVREGDSGVEAVIHRELTANAGGVRPPASASWPTRGRRRSPPLRLHDVLLWLSGSLRLTHAVALGRDGIQRP